MTDEGLHTTLDFMGRLAADERDRPLMLALAPKALAGATCGEGARRIFAFVDTFVATSKGMPPECVQSPSTTFMLGQGDAQDRAILIAALGLAADYGASFRTQACDPNRPDEHSVVLTVLHCPPTCCGREWVKEAQT